MKAEGRVAGRVPHHCPDDSAANPLAGSPGRPILPHASMRKSDKKASQLCITVAKDPTSFEETLTDIGHFLQTKARVEGPGCLGGSVG